MQFALQNTDKYSLYLDILIITFILIGTVGVYWVERLGNVYFTITMGVFLSLCAALAILHLVILGFSASNTRTVKMYLEYDRQTCEFLDKLIPKDLLLISRFPETEKLSYQADAFMYIKQAVDKNPDIEKVYMKENSNNLDTFFETFMFGIGDEKYIKVEIKEPEEMEEQEVTNEPDDSDK